MEKIMLYLSSFVPMYLLLLIKILVEILNHNLTFNILNTTMVVLLSMLIISGCVGLYLCTNSPKNKTSIVTIKSFENITDQHFLGYFSLFVLFSLTFEIERVSMAIVFVLILILIGIVYINSDLFYINPFLNILGYTFYNITYIDSRGDEHSLKIFYKGELAPNLRCTLSISGHKNFCFLKRKKTR